MRKNLLSLCVIFGLLALPLTAMAKQCESNDDCDKDEICVSDPCPACASEDENDCPPCDPNGECMSDEDPWEDFVEAFSCDTDLDCPSYFSCVEEELPCDDESHSDHSTDPPGDDTSTDPDDEKEGEDGSSGSSGSAGGAPDEEGGDDDWGDKGEPCEPELVQICMLDTPICETDEDCEEYFSCEPYMEVCSSGGAVSSDCVCADCVCDEEDPDCECPPCDCPEEEEKEEFQEEECEVLEYRCGPEQIACESDDDCPTDWECIQEPTWDESTTSVSTVDCPPCVCDPEDEDCECPKCEEEEEWEDTEPENMCLPEGWMEFFAFLFDEDFDKGETAEGNPEDKTTTDLEGSDEGPSDGELNDGSESSAAPPIGDDDSQGPQDVGDGYDPSGCAVASGTSGSTSLMLLGLLLALMLPAWRSRQTR